jgi:hypothetical protein
LIFFYTRFTVSDGMLASIQLEFQITTVVERCLSQCSRSFIYTPLCMSSSYSIYGLLSYAIFRFFFSTCSSCNDQYHCLIQRSLFNLKLTFKRTAHHSHSYSFITISYHIISYRSPSSLCSTY